MLPPQMLRVASRAGGRTLQGSRTDALELLHQCFLDHRWGSNERKGVVCHLCQTPPYWNGWSDHYSGGRTLLTISHG